jgi:protein involved in polysaccharide export with SLBB domain
MRRRIGILIMLSISLFYCNNRVAYLSAQEQEDVREQARQHYLQGKELSSQDRYREAEAEFQKAIELLRSPEIEFMRNMEKGQEETPIPASLQEKLLPRQRLAQDKIKQQQTELEEAPAASKAIEAEAEGIEQRQYYIDTGDVFDISVWQMPLPVEELRDKRAKGKQAKDGQYYIDTGDVLDIAIWQVPDLSRPEIIVRPDGKISFPLIGDIEVEGLTLSEADEIVTEQLKTYVKNPEVSIMIRRFGGQQEKMTALKDLSPSEVIVRPDGKISFPLIGDIKAESLTLMQLDAAITEKLKTYVKNPEVSVMIKRFGEKTNKVVVLGEIFIPGVYKFNRPPNIIEVVAAAGGHTKYAALNSIMVIRGPMQARPQVTRVNIAKVLQKGDLSENVQLNPNDIIYIPRSFIGEFNRFLEIFQPAFSNYQQTLNARHLHNVIHRGGNI